MATTGLSANEIYCLAQKKLTPGNLVIGNSVYALGMINTLGAGLKATLGGELDSITHLIETGRQSAFNRMRDEAHNGEGSGITGVTSRLIFHGTQVEFLSIGSIVQSEDKKQGDFFSTAANGQDLFGLLDIGYEPVEFAFGNVAYSLGFGRSILGGLKTFKRGEIKEYSDIFNETRQLALKRIKTQATKSNADTVLGIQTSVLSFGGLCEMVMIGTSAKHQHLPSLNGAITTSSLSSIELWNMAQLGYRPVELLLGTSVFSLGFAGSISAALKSFVKGEISELTQMIYNAREKAIDLIEEQAKALNANDIIGVKTYVYQLGNGLVEFLAIGTAVVKSDIKPASKDLPPQAFAQIPDNFYDSTQTNTMPVNVNQGNKPINKAWAGILVPLIVFILIFISIFQSH